MTMAQNAFSMAPQRPGRMRYLLLTVGIPCAILYLLILLTEALHVKFTAQVGLIAAWSTPLLWGLLGYFLIFKKNHCITVDDDTISETDWRQKTCCVIRVAQIGSYRRNILGEIILLDTDGNRLLCVEANMSNFDAFQQWLARYNVLENKER